MISTNIAIASDHSGFVLKGIIIKHFLDQNINIEDCGTYTPEITDYPIYANKVVCSIVEEKVQYGILICGTGIGMSIAANRYTNIRAALCDSIFLSERARSHNNSNILVLGAKIITPELAVQIVDKFFTTNFEGGRHSRRLSLIR